MATYARHHHRHNLRWLLWPFKFLFKGLFRLIAGIIELTVRFAVVLLGGVLFMVGLLLSLTIIGAIVGIPLMMAGGMMVLKGMF